MEHFFNTAGPTKPDLHYHLDPLARVDWPEIQHLIATQRYFVLHAPRQTGKTTTLLAMMKALNEGGRYACALFAGTANDIKDAWMHLYGVWLPQSGWLPAAKPGLEIYPETYEMDEKTGAFKCWLAVPVLQARV